MYKGIGGYNMKENWGTPTEHELLKKIGRLKEQITQLIYINQCLRTDIKELKQLKGEKYV